jgi:hypothetical protein
MTKNYADLMKEQNDQQGMVEFAVQEKDFFNPGVKEVTLFYSIVGEARFKLFRNPKMELIFVQVTDDWMRQAKVNIADYNEQLMVKCSWQQHENTLAIKKPEEKQYQVIKAVQIDN